ncbi:TetR/AcrR family transcriptional regulator [Lactiplantibacillus paraplantarum]|uniref:TetR/AcrR family transcriptional regulator n=1 Tax=Lactiplantibacillus paraplantarum TaxID=60520 RepID=UPI0023AA6B70|nr:TetR/AcrR family transcriptional regulator [Lactiplantibacillus paraplantarum]WEE35629.1 TetR/AcrR family transcriptional regulator [Lactiplantibacillus paraplantarum]
MECIDIKYSNKTDYTNRQIQTALLTLIEEKSFDQISINDIIDSVHCARSTFYRYYDDKYDLLQTIETKLLKKIDDHRQQQNPLTDNNHQFIQSSLESGLQYFKANFAEFHALLGPNGDHQFENKLEDGFNQRYAQLITANSVELELVRLAITAMSIRMLKYWLFNPEKISMADITESMTKIMSEGPLQYLHDHLQYASGNTMPLGPYNNTHNCSKVHKAKENADNKGNSHS